MDPNLAIVAICAVLLVGITVGAIVWARATKQPELDAQAKAHAAELARKDARIAELEEQLQRGTDANSIAVQGAQDRADAAGAAADDPDAAFRLLAGGGDGGPPDPPGGEATEQGG